MEKNTLKDLFEIKYINNITNIKYEKDIIKDAFSLTLIENTFITFISLNKISYIVYSTKEQTINFYDFNKEKIIKSIKNAHDSKIMSFRYNYNTNQNKEYMVSVSKERNIKLWELINFSCIISIEKAHRQSFIFSLCILPFRNNNFILSSSGSDFENVRVWDFNGNKIQEINNSKERTAYIDTFHSLKDDIYYIIIANYGNIKSFIFGANELYKIYQDNSEEKNDHTNFIIYDKGKEINKIILIDSCFDGFIRLWDFHNGKLLKKIKCCKAPSKLRNICLSGQNQYLFIACDNENNIKIIDLSQKKIITCIKVKLNELLSIKIIKHNLYGNCMLVKGFLSNNIQLWTPQIFQ